MGGNTGRNNGLYAVGAAVAPFKIGLSTPRPLDFDAFWDRGLAEMRAIEKRPFKAVLKELYKEVGAYVLGRENFRLPQDVMDALKERLEKDKPASFGGMKVAMACPNMWLSGSRFRNRSGKKGRPHIRYFSNSPSIGTTCAGWSSAPSGSSDAATKRSLSRGSTTPDRSSSPWWSTRCCRS